MNNLQFFEIWIEYPVFLRQGGVDFRKRQMQELNYYYVN